AVTSDQVCFSGNEAKASDVDDDGRFWPGGGGELKAVKRLFGDPSCGVGGGVESVVLHCNVLLTHPAGVTLVSRGGEGGEGMDAERSVDVTTATGDGLGTWRAEACPGKYTGDVTFVPRGEFGRLAGWLAG
ncbi:hypothetical protein V500_11011, partial [Pseudogymnoascus sp. VKM F-4518 (FW-2643)]